MFAKYLLLWFPMLLIAIGNGVIRESIIKKFAGDSMAHQVSTALLLLFFTIYIYYVIEKYPPNSSLQTVFIGIFWLILTLTFEFGFGRYRGLSWQALLAEYNLAKGRLWVLVPLWVAIAPTLIYHYFKG